MAAQKGKDLLLKLDEGGGTFATVAGLRTQRLALNADAVDITHAESAGRWRELLAGAGVRRASIAGTGIFKDADIKDPDPVWRSWCATESQHPCRQGGCKLA